MQTDTWRCLCCDATPLRAVQAQATQALGTAAATVPPTHKQALGTAAASRQRHPASAAADADEYSADDERAGTFSPDEEELLQQLHAVRDELVCVEDALEELEDQQGPQTVRGDVRRELLGRGHVGRELDELVAVEMDVLRQQWLDKVGRLSCSLFAYLLLLRLPDLDGTVGTRDYLPFLASFSLD